MKYHARIDEVADDPEKVNSEVLAEMDRDTQLLREACENWAKMSEEDLEKDDESIEL